MNSQEAYQLITRVLSGEAGSGEQQALQSWRQLSQDNERLYQNTAYAWEHATDELELDVDVAWKQVRHKIKQQTPEKRGPSLFMRIAAAVLLTGAVGLGVLYYSLSPKLVELHASAGQTLEVQLPDGSHVWLNGSSSLSYTKPFKGNERNVQLNGEAYFEVQKDPSKPFIIHSRLSTTRVLGTAFNLHAYDSVALVELNVTEGKVSFTSQTQQEVIVTAGHSAAIDASGAARETGALNPNKAAWKTRKLVFNDARLDEVFAAMGDYYHVKISADNEKIYNCHFTGEFAGRRLPEALDLLAKVMGLTYTRDGNSIRYKGKGCE